jgi:hypothetical protein
MASSPKPTHFFLITKNSQLQATPMPMQAKFGQDVINCLQEKATPTHCYGSRGGLGRLNSCISLKSFDYGNITTHYRPVKTNPE